MRIITESNGWMREAVSSANDEHIKACLFDYMYKKYLSQIDGYEISDIMSKLKEIEDSGYTIDDVVKKALDNDYDIYNTMYNMKRL